MVCMLGRWRMTAVVKRLLAENSSDFTPEEINDEKIAAQILQKRFLDADESNLLDEDDMHVYGRRPMTEPLHLVCCNACKKPIKASQYAIHAERCGSLNSVTDSSIGIDNDLAPTKPPRKGRKMSEITTNTSINQISRTNMQEENESIDHKLNTGFENQNLSSVESQSSTITTNHATVTKNSLTVSREVPVPLATKIYHCGRNSRLRFELGQIYFDSCKEGHFGNCTNQESVQENSMNVMACEMPEKNGFSQIKLSKSAQKGSDLATTVKGMPNGRYPTTHPYFGG
ncbi:hypothetical protein LUZ60_015600 [Juncus effusus]|nr:hypothetical protein LUZ60_015600 [Juncus effusus]